MVLPLTVQQIYVTNQWQINLNRISHVLKGCLSDSLVAKSKKRRSTMDGELLPLGLCGGDGLSAVGGVSLLV
jgi:hypothetical protein